MFGKSSVHPWKNRIPCLPPKPSISTLQFFEPALRPVMTTAREIEIRIDFRPISMLGEKGLERSVSFAVQSISETRATELALEQFRARFQRAEIVGVGSE